MNNSDGARASSHASVRTLRSIFCAQKRLARCLSLRWPIGEREQPVPSLLFIGYSTNRRWACFNCADVLWICKSHAVAAVKELAKRAVVSVWSSFNVSTRFNRKLRHRLFSFRLNCFFFLVICLTISPAVINYARTDDGYSPRCSEQQQFAKAFAFSFEENNGHPTA